MNIVIHLFLNYALNLYEYTIEMLVEINFPSIQWRLIYIIYITRRKQSWDVNHRPESRGCQDRKLLYSSLWMMGIAITECCQDSSWCLVRAWGVPAGWLVTTEAELYLCQMFGTRQSTNVNGIYSYLKKFAKVRIVFLKLF